MVVKPCSAQKTVLRLRPIRYFDPRSSGHMFGSSGKISVLPLFIVIILFCKFGWSNRHCIRQIADIHLLQLIDQLCEGFAEAIKSSIHQLSSSTE